MTAATQRRLRVGLAALGALALLGVLVLPSFGGTVTAGDGAVAHALTGAPGVPPPARPEADNTVTRIRVYPNGSARWTVQIRTHLDTDERVREYRAFQKRVRSNTSAFLDPFDRRITSVVGDASNATGRSMRPTNFRITTNVQQVPRRWGIVTYEFTWLNFTASDGDSLVVGDVFQGGFFLAANDSLELRAPDGYRIAEPAPDPDHRGDGVVVWRGRENFAHERPRVRIEPAPGNETRTSTATVTPTASSTATPTVTRTPTSTTGDDDPPATGGGFPGSLMLGGGAIALAVLLGGYLAASRGLSATIAGVGGADDPSEEAEPRIVTDADRVVQLLNEEGGQIRQAEVEERMDWSSSKTSRTLSDMADEGRIEKIRIGRENVIRLPEDDEP